jgi:hypothetical protein
MPAGIPDAALKRPNGADRLVLRFFMAVFSGVKL